MNVMNNIRISWSVLRCKLTCFSYTIMIVITIMFNFRCSDFFMAPGPQPSYVNGEIDFIHHLNVFGILRPDSLQPGLPQSFIKLEPTFPVDNWELENLSDVSVLIYRIMDIEK